MAEFEHTIHPRMSELGQLTAPSLASKDRMWATLEAQLEFDPEPPEDPSSGSDNGGSGAGSGAGAGGLAHATKVAGATLALAGAGLLVLALGARALRTPAPAAAPHSQLVPTPERSPAATPSPPLAEPPAATQQIADPSAAAPEPAPAGAAVQADADQPQTRAPAKLRAPDPLAVEMALLDRARGAAGAEAKLAALDDHRRSFARGQLAHQRELMRVELLCELGRLADAKVAAEAILSTASARSIHARVRTSCPALELSQVDDSP